MSVTTERSATLNRRRFLRHAGVAAAVGTAGSVVAASPAEASGHGRTSIPRSGLPKPIEFVVDAGAGLPDPFRFIHFGLPGPDGATTQVLEIPSDGLDANPSTIGDFEGFTAFAVIAGTATGGDGESFDCEFDVRVMQGKYIAEDGKQRHGTFAFF